MESCQARVASRNRWELRKSDPPYDSGGPEGEADLERLIRPASERQLLCRFCGEPVTADDHRISIEGRHVHRRVNPAGFEFEIGCFDDAPGAAVTGEPTAEHSWFAGYVWSYSACRCCDAHLGWFFEASDPSFHGLILNRLREQS